MEAKPNGCVGELDEMLNVRVAPRLREQSIYRVPQRIRQTDPQAYTPQVISIGPFHSTLGSSSDNTLHQMEQLKLHYLHGFLDRTCLYLDDLVSKFEEWEDRIRCCYDGHLSFNSKDFIKIMIIDACFIVEHFVRICHKRDWFRRDPILRKPGLHYDIYRDLILLENQIPFFVLEDIHKLMGISMGISGELRSFLSIAIENFKYINSTLPNINPEEVEYPKHFTDLLRTSLLPSKTALHIIFYGEIGDGEMVGEIEHVYSVSQLSEAGLEFEGSASRNLLDLNFDEKGVLIMPRLHVHHATESYMRNIIAFEECHFFVLKYRFFSEYFIILDFLINTEKDVSILVDKKIIVNRMGDAKEVVTMVNNLCKTVTLPIQYANYTSVCPKLNDFYKNSISKYKNSFLQEYFNTPWKTASSVTALLLVLLTLIQTICSICSL